MRGNQSPSDLRIILIEDSQLLCAMLRDIFDEMDGVEVVADADSELNAIAELEQHHADLAIVDIELKAGSGLGVLSQLHAEPARFGRPLAVVFSNSAHSAMRARCAALGVTHFFDKSFQLDDLLDFIQNTFPHH